MAQKLERELQERASEGGSTHSGRQATLTQQFRPRDPEGDRAGSSRDNVNPKDLKADDLPDE